MKRSIFTNEAPKALVLPRRLSLASAMLVSGLAGAQQDTAAGVKGNVYNPDITLILSGAYSLGLDAKPVGPEFGGNAKPLEGAPQGFGLGESELGLYSNVDPNYFGGLNLALSPENAVAVEEAFFQTLALGNGVTIKGGRFFSAIGYLNERHAHTWDFADNPLPYKILFGTQFAQDGVQLKWLAPSNQFWEFGAELGSGGEYPASMPDHYGVNTAALFAHSGGDIGDSHSWRAGISWLGARANGREAETMSAQGVKLVSSFTGNSNTIVIDGVWKWAPLGNAKQRQWILQSEWMLREESGDLDAIATNVAYRSRQQGFYAQFAYRFARNWRAGMRFDALDSGVVDVGTLGSQLDTTRRLVRGGAMMIDYSPSEFSRLRLQIANMDSDSIIHSYQILLQYQMSLGAHGAHAF